jgi:hypothetical protein
VSINIDELLREHEEGRIEAAFEYNDEKSKENIRPSKSSGGPPRKRKSEGEAGASKKKAKIVAEEVSEASLMPKPKITLKLKLGPKPEEEVFPCCLCVSSSTAGLLRVHDLPRHVKDAGHGQPWMAHEQCASIIPETWVDIVEVGDVRTDGSRATEPVVFGVDGIVRDRWNLVRCWQVASTQTHTFLRNAAHA